MFPLWDEVIAPTLQAAGARRVIEIGALRGENTEKVLASLDDAAELHVIDPAPEFDPDEYERALPGRFHFHRGLSLDVLPTLPVPDAVLVDGDHNWYTVRNELQILGEQARQAGALLPLLLLHDVGWPYGRRDLYYEPGQIPPEHRQPHGQGGMRPGTKRLLDQGGLNQGMENALVEGGPRNGVLTALEDFIDEHDRALRCVIVPVYYGLAIVAEQDRLDATPQLVEVLDGLESAAGRRQQAEIAEDVRVRSAVFEQNVLRNVQSERDRSRERHLALLKDALLDRHYLENEVRLAHLAHRLSTGRPVNVGHLRDPVRYDRSHFEHLELQRLGPGGPDDQAGRSFVPHAPMGRPQLDHLHRCLDTLRASGALGDVAEYTADRAGASVFARAYLDAHELAEPEVWVLGRFRASRPPDTEPKLTEAGVAEFSSDLNQVRDTFDRFDVLDDRVHFVNGAPEGSLPGAPIGSLSLLRIGRAPEAEVSAVLDALLGRVQPGGFVIIEGEGEGEARGVVEGLDIVSDHDLPCEEVDRRTVAFRTPETGRAAEPAPAAEVRAVAGAPLASALPVDSCDLTVVVVLYNMRREAERTLRALSRTYQRGVEDLAYEVLVVDNGSNPDQRIDQDFVARFGPEFRFVELGDDATPSPVGALNAGVRLGRGEHFALMIDGAHVVTPGVLRFGMLGLRSYEPAVVATQPWFVGPADQGDSIEDGYDEDHEDRLFDSIDWPADGYRLFDIGTFMGDRDWFDGLWESNCIFVSRKLLEQCGGFDESFSMAGGGYANLEIYERLGATPGVTMTTILGEASFHQVHGGTTTNVADAAQRRSRVFSYGEHYAAERGRGYRGPGKPIHYIGHFADPSMRRTKSRNRSAARFLEVGAAVAGDGPPVHPVPMPEELRTAFTEAVWRTRPWDRASWLGQAIDTAPTDLLAYQEILSTVRPEWIIEVGTADGARTLFLASICDLLDHGNVVSIDRRRDGEPPAHPRISYVRGRNAHRRPAVRQVRKVMGGDPASALVILGDRRDRPTTMRQFEAYQSFVPVGSYVVVADTVLNGNPVWPAFGPGPAEALKRILGQWGDFVVDPDMEKYSLSFNPSGYLKRIS